MDQNRYLEVINRAIEELDLEKEPRGLYEPIRYILDLGGKRIRPVILLMACDIYDGDENAALPAALAVEVFHNFSLIHDDIMDRAPLRRGKPTVHEQWNANTAILSGDTMLVKAYEQLLQLPAHILKPALEIFNRTAAEVCEGQQYDMDFEDRDDVMLDEYLEMIRLKTAVLLGAALKLGGLVANAPEEDLDHLYTLGIETGMVFQLKDDLLDTYGDSVLFGKRQYGDIVANKKTYLYLLTLKSLVGKDREMLARLFANQETDPEVKVRKVLHYFDKVNVKELTERTILEHYRKAQAAFHALQIPDEKKQILSDFTEMLLGRKF
ncbi:MAG: polyprenyl synthetase family protein [Bacteroidales bacterium]|nr:polyprenyl synthetase family protein [Bacteroidales bacterium]